MSSGEHSDSVLTGQQTVSPTELTRTNWENEGSGFELAWSLLSVEHKEKAFLENATGRAKPGQLTAIMGHSGSGKTTLLKALTGRGLVTSGKVLLNGTQVNPSCPWFQKAVPFVADRETLEATATTIEVITFSASLRLSSDTAQEKIEMLVSDIIVQLKLEACAQTQCRHLSAGERRRLSVAVELVVGPKTLVLDEPTSGLDSFHGVILMRCLKQVVAGGTSILLSIHHPNLAMWVMLDHVVLLHEGRVMVQGTGVSIVDTFERSGYQLPPNENPADWILAMSQTTEHGWSVGRGFFPTMNDQSSEGSDSQEDMITKTVRLADRPVGPLMECKIILARELRHVIRDTNVMVPRLFLSIGGGTAFAVVFAGVADGHVDSIIDLLSHAGALFFLFFCSSIVAPSAMKDAIIERPVFEREYRTGHYRIWTYILCKTLSDAMTFLTLGLFTCLISFYFIGLKGRFWYLFLVYSTSGWVSTLITVAVVAACRDPTSSVNYVGFIFLPQALLSGFYVSVSELPSWLQWAPWTMPYTWTFRLALEEEFSFCATPSERDGHLLNCMKGLKDINDGTFIHTDKSIFTTELTGAYRGKTGVAEYRSLFSRGDDPEGFLLYDGFFVKDNFDMMIHSVSESQCSITTANVLSGILNPVLGIKPGVNVQTLFGFRLEFSMTPEGTVVNEEHLSLGSGKDVAIIPWLDATKISDEVCNTLENFCDSEYYSFENRSQCVAAMATLPLSNKNKIGVNTLTGNSTGCRQIHMFIARVNPDHCAHISLPYEADSNGNFKCVDDNVNKTYFNFTEAEDNMFQKVAINYGLFDTTRGRAYVSGDRGDYTDDPAAEGLSTLQKNGEFEDINVYCYSYLEQNAATSEYTAVYWSALFGTVVLARVLTGFFLHLQAHRRD